MKKKILVGGIVFLMILVISAIYFSNTSQSTKKSNKYKFNYSNITYWDCIESGEKCENVLDTRNPRIEQEITEIVNQVIRDKIEWRDTIYIKKVVVFNDADKIEGFIDLDCSEGTEESYEMDEEITKEIANKLFIKYPEDFTEGSKRDSWVSVGGCFKTYGTSNGFDTTFLGNKFEIFDGTFQHLDLV